MHLLNASKEQQAWYYNAIANILIDKGNASGIPPVMGREMLDLCEEVF
jgi:hypothetical protein